MINEVQKAHKSKIMDMKYVPEADVVITVAFLNYSP